jgi:hypothetical protein
MNKTLHVKVRPCPAASRRHRAGISTLDTLVAFTLLVTTLSVATPLVVRHGRLLKSQRDYRLALDELSNQMDRLIAMPAGELPAAVQQLAPSDFLTERIPSAQLTGETNQANTGMRVILRISWNEMSGSRMPVTLAGWVSPPTQTGGTAEGVAKEGQP